MERINEWFDAHITRYIDAVNQEEHMQWRDSEIDMMRELVYPNMEEYHLLLSAYTTAMFEPVIHNYTMEEALRCLKTVEVFFLPGWKQLMGF